MAAFYIVAGIGHFIKPDWYLRVMPPFFPNHRTLVVLSGIAEVLLGIALFFPLLKNSALILIIAMLVLFLTVHVYMLSGKKAAAGIPVWVLILRLPLQFVLMYWAYSYLDL
ncbi:MAG: hypothetical protein R3356_08565 [Eudoraea sp.]|nr:hypothetical protein [Eudoraea sp.]